MDERERVDELDRGRGREQRLRASAPTASPAASAEHRPDALAAERSGGSARSSGAELGRQRELAEVVLDELAQLLRRPRHRPRRAPRARSELRLDLLRELGELLERPRSPARDPRSPRAARASPRASSAPRLEQLLGALPSAFRPRSSRSPPPPAGFRRGCRSRACPPRRTQYRLANVTASSIATSAGHLAAVELVDRDAQRAALDDAEPVGRPALRRGRDPRVELGARAPPPPRRASRAHGSISPAYCEPISAPERSHW